MSNLTAQFDMELNDALKGNIPLYKFKDKWIGIIRRLEQKASQETRTMFDKKQCSNCGFEFD